MSYFNKKLILVIIILSISGEFCKIYSQSPPYPPSKVFSGISWDYNNMVRKANGSDLWPMTWADDDNLYAIWGDGKGFDGKDRASWGVARISGNGDSFTGTNLYGNGESFPGNGGKSNGGIISIQGILYAYIQKQGTWEKCNLWLSNDHGVTWSDLGTIFNEPEKLFADPAVINFGKDYSGARDRYVYLYGHDDNNIYLARVDKDSLAQRNMYKFFSGTPSNPSWDSEISNRSSIFYDSNGVMWGVNCSYHPQTGRYLLTVRHSDSGDWGIFDAPEPWGPWTTVAYYSDWLDSKRKITFIFNQKWSSPNGDTLWMVWSGPPDYDAFMVIKATLSFSIQDSSALSSPSRVNISK